MIKELCRKTEQLGCVNILCDDKEGKQIYGTGTCFRTSSNDYDLVITAGHCIPNLRTEAITIIGSDLNIVSVFRPEEYKKESAWDFCVLVVAKIPSTLFAFELSVDLLFTKDSEYYLLGYPHIKRNTENEWHRFSAEFSNKTADHKLLFNLINSEHSANYSEKQLLEGMSGGPIIRKSESQVCGIFTHTLISDGAFHEICAISLTRIIEWMRQKDLIYLDGRNSNSFYILESTVNKEWIQPKDTEYISAILLGKSGAGKSAFAKTMMKNASMFDITGSTRTTRSTIKYNIRLMCNKPAVSIQFFNKEKFVKFRLKRCYEILYANYQAKLDPSSKIEMDKDESQTFPTFSSYSLEISDLVQCAFSNSSFFDIEELYYLKPSIQKSITDVFITVFTKDTKGTLPKIYEKEKYKKICESLEITSESQENVVYNSSINDKDLKATYTLDDMVRLVFEKIHEIVYPVIAEKYSVDGYKVGIDEDVWTDDFLHELINNCLKVCGQNSLTGFVEAVTIDDRVSDEYIDCFQSQNLYTLTLLDTYGLDHMAQLTTFTLSQRLWELKLENPVTDFIFYIRKLGTDAPSDLESIIPNIYAANSSFRVYTIFTGIDDNIVLKNKKGEVLKLIEINQYNKIPAVDYFIESTNVLTPIPHSIYRALVDNGVPTALSTNIYQSIRDNLIPYCASECVVTRNDFLANNVYHINKLMTSIINKEYLGTGLINLKYIEKSFTVGSQPEVIKIKLMELLEKMFELASIKWYSGTSGTGHWRTQEANITRLQIEILGYSGTHNHQWNERFFSSYNKVFSKLSEEDFNILFSTSEGLNDAATIQQLLNNFGETFLRCHTYSQVFTFPSYNHNCNGCTKDCFRSALLQAYQSDELKQSVENSRYEWLNARCDFGYRFKEIKTIMYDLFIKEFNRTIIPEAKAHNARKVVGLISQKQDVISSFEHIKKEVDSLLVQYEGRLNNKRIAEILSEFK